mgnify:CR=1 FL=1
MKARERVKSGYRQCRNDSGYVHVEIATRALKRELPEGAEVHHVDGNKLNNEPSNLVICHDSAYHALLHVRTRIVRAGGNPNTHALCSTCKELKPHAAFNKFSGSKALGLQKACRSCQAAYQARYKRPKRAA